MSDNTLDIDVQHSVTLSVDVQTLSVDLVGPASLSADLVTEVVVVNSGGVDLCVSPPNSTEVVVAPTNAISVVTGVQGPAGKDGTPGSDATYVPGFDTSGLAEGRAVYLDGDYSLAYTDAAVLPGGFALGVFDGFATRVMAAGTALAEFTAGSPTPVADELVFLARADAEAGAAGKLTTLPPTQGFVAPVGKVLETPGDYATTRKATIYVRVLHAIKKAV